MYFPEEIWEIIISYFKFYYKEPLHYNAIMNVPEFYHCVIFHRESYKYGLEWNKSLCVDSYYMRLIFNSEYNLSEKVLKRGVASQKIYDDFVNIFKTYNQRGLTNIFINLSY